MVEVLKVGDLAFEHRKLELENRKIVSDEEIYCKAYNRFIKHGVLK